MFNTVRNINRKANKYGDVHFISFLGAILSRLAYMDDNRFLTSYNSIMGPVIQPRILQGINSVTPNNLAELLDDQTIFGLNKDTNDIFINHEYEFKGKNYIDFIGLNMPQNINIINGDIAGNTQFPLPGTPTSSDSVKYISIGWSNYGEIYVVADKRMPNTIFLIFRGTYSAKTASLYSKPTSVVPLTVCKDSQGRPEQFLYGIFKPTTEMIHTIIESMRYLATDFLQATQQDSVKIFTTGHSLGGAMCTNFAYLWMGIKKTQPYNAAPYNVLADNIVCVSLGAPRCMGSSVAKKFCNFSIQKKILYLRITTRGDPVPALPPKTGFQHPCSDDKTMRMEVTEDCNATLTMRPLPNVSYSTNLDCLNYKARTYIPNALSHTIYLDILYTKAVDIPKFFKGIGIAQEVSRDTDKSTVCRLVMGSNGNYNAVFFNVNKARERPTNVDVIEEVELSKPTEVDISQTPPAIGGGFFDIFTKKTAPTPTPTPVSIQAPQTNSRSFLSRLTPSKPVMKIGGEVAEDRRMTMQAFNTLIQQMTPLQGNLCPQRGQIVNPFNNQIMPDLSCPGLKFGGKRGKKRTQKRKKNGRNKSRRY
jgi:hypothetical protein